jgi:diaminopimelate decarboxylase
MSFTREKGRAALGGVLLDDVLTHAGVTTPCYVYDVDGIVERARALRDGFGSRESLVCFAVKANTAGRILRRLAQAGVGADVVSGGELTVALGAGIPAERIVWSGVAKRHDEIDQALTAGEQGILAIQIESVEEVARVAARAASLRRKARVSIRVNPSVQADTHAHIATGHDEAKFGVALADLPAALDRLDRTPDLQLTGLSMHVGSQMTTTDAFAQAGEVLCDVAAAVRDRGVTLSYIDFGGGYGIDYGDGCPASPAEFAQRAVEISARRGFGDLRLLCEPGRSLVASSGVLVARVLGEKRWNRPATVGWMLLDAGMNDLMRPALYGARHRIEPLLDDGSERGTYRVAGPVCESTDDFGTFELPIGLRGHVVIRDAGAYGYTMANQYNGRSMPTEVFLEGGVVSAVSSGPSVADWARGRLAT